MVGDDAAAGVAENVALAADDTAGLVAFARANGIDLVIVGPEGPLANGLADALRATNIRVCGPSRAAAQIEASKSFAKQIMQAAGIPTAQAHTCTSPAEVTAALDEFGPPYVVKADGLAAGKGVLVTGDRTAAQQHAQACGTVVIEEFLPQQMGEADVKAAIAAAIKEVAATGPKDMGKVMAALKQRHAGQMDFGQASGLVKELLQTAAS